MLRAFAEPLRKGGGGVKRRKVKFRRDFSREGKQFISRDFFI